MSSTERVDANDTVSVQVLPKEEIVMSDAQKNRLAALIKEKVDLLKLENTSLNPARSIQLDVYINTYDEGDENARFLLAGLGAMKIETTTKVYDLASGKLIAEFDVVKTFAAGGIYGATTRIDDIEVGLAEGIARTVCNE